jgi:hypothetical protein
MMRFCSEHAAAHGASRGSLLLRPRPCLISTAVRPRASACVDLRRGSGADGARRILGAGDAGLRLIVTP